MPLSGGRLTAGVVRVGVRVRRPTGPHSPFDHRLLRHLEAVGLGAARRLLGADEREREGLSFIGGSVPPTSTTFRTRPWPRPRDCCAGCMMRPPGSELAGGREVVCHNDPSPCNYVFVDDRPAAIIDFDNAAPGDRVRDVVYAGWLWTMSADGGPPHLEQGLATAANGRRLRLPDTSGLLDALLAARRRTSRLRSRAAGQLTRPSPTTGAHQRPGSARMAWLREHAEAFRAASGPGACRSAD